MINNLSEKKQNAGKYEKLILRFNQADQLIFSYKMWKNGQTYFKNLALTPQDFLNIFGYFSISYMKGKDTINSLRMFFEKRQFFSQNMTE